MDILISVLSVIVVGAMVTAAVFFINLTLQLRETAKAVELAAKSVAAATQRLEQSIDRIDETAAAYAGLAKSVEARVESTKEMFDAVNAITHGAKTGWLNLARFALGFITGLKRA
ncbi:MAG: hypothetical protein PHW69_00920 [Elusimicrobiaceae bacterium]|nr:hypothetical protein [Elusimicrobiaceae bacterium]